MRTRGELLERAMSRFEEQFKVKLKPTGDEVDYEENDGVKEVGVEVEGMIESKVNGLDFSVDGWFLHDIHSNEIRCVLSIQFNGELLHEDRAIQSQYNVRRDKWDDLDVDFI